MAKQQPKSPAQPTRYNHDEYYETGKMPPAEPVRRSDHVTFKPLLREQCTSRDFEDRFR